MQALQAFLEVALHGMPSSEAFKLQRLVGALLQPTLDALFLSPSLQVCFRLSKNSLSMLISWPERFSKQLAVCPIYRWGRVVTCCNTAAQQAHPCSVHGSFC